MGFFLFLCTPCFSLVAKDYYKNSTQLDAYRLAFNQLEHPPTTALITINNEVGDLQGGSGDYCDFFVGQLRSFHGTRPDIEAFYQGKLIDIPFRGKKVAVELLFVEDNQNTRWQWINALPYTCDEYSEWLDRPITTQDKLYLVYIFDVAYPATYDLLRC